MSYLCKHTQNVIQQDRAIAGLATLLNPDQLVAELNQMNSRAMVQSATLTYLRYKPGTNCLAKYVLRTARGEADVYAKAFNHGDLPKLGKNYARRTLEDSRGTGCVILPEKRIYINTFPNDAKLPSAKLLTSEDHQQRLLRRVLDVATPSSKAKIVTLAYKPERRWVAKVTWPESRPIVFKFFSRKEFRNVLLTGYRLDRCKTVAMPIPIGFSRKHRSQAFLWQDGIGLRDEIIRSDSKYQCVALAGTALAEFHKTAKNLKASPCRNYPIRLKQLSAHIAFLLPHLSSLMMELTTTINQWWQFQDETCGVVHGDFYDKQVIIDKDQAHILDIDNIEVGNPLRDLGLFIAHLERDAICGYLESHQVEPITTALLRGYCSHTNIFDYGQLRNYIVFGLLQLVHHPFRRNESSWPQRIEAILLRAFELLVEGHPTQTNVQDIAL